MTQHSLAEPTVTREPTATGSRPPDSAAKERPAPALGRYQLLQEIAAGQFCTVHRARSTDATDAREVVALKRLRSAHRLGQGRARLLREARVGLSLRAPNLVRVLEIHDEPELFLVMEHVEGATLRQLMASASGAMTLRHAIPILADVLRALSVLHTWKDEDGAPSYLVHQAPTARHILIGVDGVARLIDLSHVHGQRLGARADLDGFDPRELAPEQLVRHAAIDPRCDIFIVGNTLKALLERAGEASFAGDAQLRNKLGPLQAVCERARAPRRGDRFWSADEMTYSLLAAAREIGPLAPPQEIGDCVRRTLEPTHQPVPSQRRAVPPPPPPSGERRQLAFPSPLPPLRQATAVPPVTTSAKQPDAKVAVMIALDVEVDALAESGVRTRERSESSPSERAKAASTSPAPAAPVPAQTLGDTTQFMLPTTNRLRLVLAAVGVALAVGSLITLDFSRRHKVAVAAPAPRVEPNQLPPPSAPGVDQEPLRPVVTSLADTPIEAKVRPRTTSGNRLPIAAAPARKGPVAPSIPARSAPPGEASERARLHTDLRSSFYDEPPTTVVHELPANPY